MTLINDCIFCVTDEAELFNPFGSGSAKDNVGEWANIEITDVHWADKGTWDALGTPLTAKVEIKDGAFVSVTSDFNNNGTINKADYDDRHGAVGSLVLLAAPDIARYYTWVDLLGNHVFNLNFQGAGGVEYAYVYNDNDGSVYETETIYDGKNLAVGTVHIVGANNSPTITSGSLSLSVGGGSDWTRFTVFSVTVDMAFNHDRADNTGSDGINIRTDASDNTEHYSAEFVQ
ncbi:MAG: hypothetical protein LBU65_05660, partial [Planctomycetaceae bacterium]|nr:hypothetical protein [Planctomycetaceae bacterium]